MNELQIAKSLEIVGVFIGTFIAGILLNREFREFVGSFSGKVLSILNEIFVNGRFSIIQRFLMPKEGFPPGLKRQLLWSILAGFAWVLLLIAKIFNIDWLFWVSVSFLGIFTLWHIVDVFKLTVMNRSKQYTVISLLFLLIMRLINCLIIFPIVDTLLLFSVRVVYLIFLILNSIARTNRVRFISAMIGFMLVLIGLIWEYCLID